MKRDDLTKVCLQETKDDESRFKNMDQKVLTDLCSPMGKSPLKSEDQE